MSHDRKGQVREVAAKGEECSESWIFWRLNVKLSAHGSESSTQSYEALKPVGFSVFPGRPDSWEPR